MDRGSFNDNALARLTQPKMLVSIGFTLAIVIGAFTVLAPFLLAVLWAAILAIASWPLHEWVQRKMPTRPGLAAWSTTGLVLTFLVGPMTFIIVFISRDLFRAVSFVIAADQNGKVMPPVLKKIPAIGDWLVRYWDRYLAHPGQISQVLNRQFDSVRDFSTTLLVDLTGRLATLFFALWILYFFYREGVRISTWVNQIGYKWLDKRWPSYVHQLPDAIRATVNGIVIVAFAEAVLLSFLMYFCGVISPVTLGVVCAIVAFIPLAAPLLLLVIASFLYASGSEGAAITLFVVGNVIVLAADYAVRPSLMRGGTELPFLAILFGIFGGAATMGIVGLIIGPVLLVLLAVLFREAAVDEAGVDLDLTSVMPDGPPTQPWPEERAAEVAQTSTPPATPTRDDSRNPRHMEAPHGAQPASS
jgi:predicted PurR-regulated permease PerM